MTEPQDGEDPAHPATEPSVGSRMSAYIEELARHKAKVAAAAAALTDEEKERLTWAIYALKDAGLPVPPDLSKAEDFERAIRTAAKALLAVSLVPQTKLADVLGVSQSSVSHALSDRKYGLTLTEVWVIEALAGVRRGKVYELASYLVPETVEEFVSRQPGMTPEAAAGMVAMFHALEDPGSGEGV